MENNLEKMMLPFKVQQLLQTIIEKKGLDVKDAMQYLYSSDLYNLLSEESSYLWQLGTLNLYDLLKKEKRIKKQKQNNSTPILLFLSFCLENYREHKTLTAEETLFLFNNHGVLDYLSDVFETLHTQGKDYIMNDIENFITNKKLNK